MDLTHSVDSFGDGIFEATFDAETLPTHGEIIELIESLHSGADSPSYLRRGGP